MEPKNFTFRIPQDVADKLMALARRTHRSRANVIVLLIRTANIDESTNFSPVPTIAVNERGKGKVITEVEVER